MVVVPAVRPDTIPVPTVAFAVVLLLHKPLAVASVSTVVNPVHTKFNPPMDAGAMFTVTGSIAIQAPGFTV